MDLNPTPHERAFREELRAWLASNVPAPYEGSLAEESPALVAYLRAWQRRLYEGGWLGLTWPKEYGGRGLGPVEQSIFMEEMALASAPQVLGLVGIALIGPTIIAHGTEVQKRQYIAPMLAGDKIWCQGYSEPNAGSDLGALTTRAVADGDHFVVNGQKVWTSFAHVADYCFALVRTDPSVAKYKGITCLLIDMKSPGVSTRPLRMMSGDADFSEVFFTDVRVPASQVLGEVNGGWIVGMTALMHERANLGGGAQVALARLVDHLAEAVHTLPRAHGSAAEDPLVRQKIASIWIELEVFRLTAARALSRVGAGGQPGPEGSILKLFYSDLAQRAAQSLMEILGPYGQLTSGPSGNAPYSYLRSRGGTIEGGTSEMLRNTVAQRVLGLPKSY
ncbi:MAG: acyl-CoA dehydrogenase family protein [Thermoanaerobaculia bacterium]